MCRGMREYTQLTKFILYFEATGIKLIHDYHILRNTKLLECFQKLAGSRYKVFIIG